MHDADIATWLADLSARAYRHMTPWTAQQFASTLSNPHALVAHDAHAFVLGLVIVDQVEILALAADPDVPRRGHGSLVLRKFESLAHGRGATEAFLEVAARNTPAIALYSKHGFTEIGRRKAYYHHPDGSADDAICMSKQITLRDGTI